MNSLSILQDAFNTTNGLSSIRQSKLTTKIRKEAPKEEPSINAQLLERGNFISKLMAGVYSYLPLGQRVLTKIETIIRDEMNQLGAHEVLLPALQPKENWDQTGRWDEIDILFKLKGVSDRDLALGPTHEEVITPLCGKFIHSYKDLPIALYQIQTKFRNEVRAKSGLLRGREFRMKDLYSFHATIEDLDTYYDKVLQSYFKIFERCGLGSVTHLTLASGGSFSKYSHEFQTITDSGEDIIHLCDKCQLGINKEIISEQGEQCPRCNNQNLSQEKAIEVGNIFKLMNRFSNAFQLRYQSGTGQASEIFMGCYGIGSSRLIGAVVETFNDKNGIIWPMQIAPFSIHLISLCQKPEDVHQANSIYSLLKNNKIETLYDDRLDITAGARFGESDLLGIPFKLIISPKTLSQNSVELKLRRTGESQLIPIAELINFVESARGAN